MELSRRSVTVRPRVAHRAYNAKPYRNLAIYALWRAGWKMGPIAQAFGISIPRVQGILNGKDYQEDFRCYRGLESLPGS